MSNQPTVIVTGADGFVGSQVVRRLLARGRPPVIVRRSSAGCRPQDADLAGIRTTKDLFGADDQELGRLLAGSDVLIHCAWFTNPQTYLASIENLQCLIGTIRLCKAFIAAGGRKFVGVGTCSEYEPSLRAIDVSAPLRPSTLYAACKASTFLTLDALLGDAGCHFSWCRLFYLFGEGEHPDRLTPHLHAQLSKGCSADLTDGSQTRDFLDVHIAGQMIADLALSAFVGPANICSGIGRTVRDHAEAIADKYGRRDLLRFGARPIKQFDPPVVVGIPTVLQ